MKRISYDDMRTRDLVRALDAAEKAAFDVASENGDASTVLIRGLREGITVARVRAEDLAIETGVDLEWARTPDEREIDPYEGWLDYGIVIDGAEINVRTSPEDAERLVAFLGKAEAERDLDQELKRAQLEVAKAKIADRKPIKPAKIVLGSTTVYADVEDGQITLAAHGGGVHKLVRDGKVVFNDGDAPSLQPVNLYTNSVPARQGDYGPKGNRAD